jgi:hypothetical protein
MNILREGRKRLHERGYFGRVVSEEYIIDQLNRWNSQPPTRTKFCSRCGSEVRWFREAPGHSVATGKPGHSYHLKCPRYGDVQHEMSDGADARMAVLHAEMHYTAREYRFREDDRESFNQEDLW